MARKRDRSKRKDYRKGGRVKYAFGGRPSRRDYSSGDEYEIALEQWKNTKKLGSTATEMPARTSGPAKRFPTPAPTPAPAPVRGNNPPVKVFSPEERDMYDSSSGQAKPRQGGFEDVYGVGSLGIKPPLRTHVSFPDPTRPLTAADFAEFGKTGGPSSYPRYDVGEEGAFEPATVTKTTQPYTPEVEKGLWEKVKSVLPNINKSMKDTAAENPESTASAQDKVSHAVREGIKNSGLEVSDLNPLQLVDILSKVLGKDATPENIVTLADITGDKTQADAIKEMAGNLQERKDPTLKEPKSILETMPTKFSGVGPGLSSRAIAANYQKAVKAAEAAGEPPPPPPKGYDPDPEEEEIADFGMGRESDLASAMQTLYGGSAYRGESGRDASTEQFEGDTGIEYQLRGYTPPTDELPYKTSAEGQKFIANYNRRLEGLDTDVDGNPMPLHGRHYTEAQQAMNNLGRQPTAEETQNWLYEKYPENYKASLKEQGVISGASPEEIIRTWEIRNKDTISTDQSVPTYNPETGMIEKFSETEGTLSWTPTEFAQANNIQTEGEWEFTSFGEDNKIPTETSGSTTITPQGITDNTSRQAAMDIIAGRRKGPQIPPAQQAGYQRDAYGELVLDAQRNPIPMGITADSSVQQIGGIPDAVTPSIEDPTALTTEDATVTSAAQQQPITAATYAAAPVATDTLVAGEQGAIGDSDLAKAAQVDRVTPIQAATVEIPEGALTERVVGTLSPNATAIAAQAAGTTLSRVTRAKKQLRNAGISEQAITDLGNDPEDLEDRLMDLTEQERGVIGGLPEEALVSNQIDSLLKGMENGEIPAWANPAVAAVEQMLAERGLEASTVGRDNLFNAIIQSAVPIAQANAQAIQQSVAQTREIESREEIFNAQARQQTALQNASNVFQMDMAQFNADQQTALSNSKFLQTVGLTEATNKQQAAIQNAMLMSQANLAEADFYQQAQIQNAQAFLNMNMENLSNAQQATVLTAQINQQNMLSNQSAQNAAAQFNATSENQTQQFMSNLAQQIELNNSQLSTSISQFNAQQTNAANATRFQIEADLNQAKAAMATDINKFNTQLAFNREQWNAENAQAVEQSNIAWRRQANTVNNAAANQVTMQNAMNTFNLNEKALSFLWQELRDQAAFDFQRVENFEDRKTQVYVQSLESQAVSAANMGENLRAIGLTLASLWTGQKIDDTTRKDLGE